MGEGFDRFGNVDVNKRTSFKKSTKQRRETLRKNGLS